jgi:hypothetical protein
MVRKTTWGEMMEVNAGTMSQNSNGHEVHEPPV